MERLRQGHALYSGEGLGSWVSCDLKVDASKVHGRNALVFDVRALSLDETFVKQAALLIFETSGGLVLKLSALDGSGPAFFFLADRLSGPAIKLLGGTGHSGGWTISMVAQVARSLPVMIYDGIWVSERGQKLASSERTFALDLARRIGEIVAFQAKWSRLTTP